MSTWSEFKNVFYDQLVVNGLQENRKFLEQKVEETKNFIKEQGLKPGANVNGTAADAKATAAAPGIESKMGGLLGGGLAAAGAGQVQMAGLG